MSVTHAERNCLVFYFHKPCSPTLVFQKNKSCPIKDSFTCCTSSVSEMFHISERIGQINKMFNFLSVSVSSPVS